MTEEERISCVAVGWGRRVGDVNSSRWPKGSEDAVVPILSPNLDQGAGMNRSDFCRWRTELAPSHCLEKKARTASQGKKSKEVVQGMVRRARLAKLPLSWFARLSVLSIRSVRAVST